VISGLLFAHLDFEFDVAAGPVLGQAPACYEEAIAHVRLGHVGGTGRQTDGLDVVWKSTQKLPTPTFSPLGTRKLDVSSQSEQSYVVVLVDVVWIVAFVDYGLLDRDIDRRRRTVLIQAVVDAINVSRSVVLPQAHTRPAIAPSSTQPAPAVPPTVSKFWAKPSP
jgi:hypothetical protein